MAFIVAGGALLLALLVGTALDSLGESPVSKWQLGDPRDRQPDEVERESDQPNYEN